MTVLFPGSFDPFTRGHADLVTRGLTLFDRMVIAVGYNEHKQGWMPVEDRVRAIKDLYAHEPRVAVVKYTGLTVDLAKEMNIPVILRGVRSVQDYEYERNIAEVNRHLTGIETVLLYADPQLACLSSSVVRELAHFGRDITEFLPQKIAIDK